MYEACETGDCETMLEAAREAHGEEFGYKPCHDDDYYPPEEETQETANGWGWNRGAHGWRHDGWSHGRWYDELVI